MSPPTSIDGTDITGATIDGTDVTEITVDGDTVFTAESLPVAYSNLVAWYPFDSAEYGGSNADDVTALFNSGQSGDSTAYDGTVNGATYQSTRGVVDVNAGSNSGAFEGDGSNDFISFSNPGASTPITLNFWAKADSFSDPQTVARIDFTNGDIILVREQDVGVFQVVNFNDGGFDNVSGISFDLLTHMHTVTISNSTFEYFIDGNTQGTNNRRSATMSDFGVLSSAGVRFWDGVIDDVRLYDKILSSTEINDIYDNTEP